jgi:CRP-like cAMP-binding protein
VVSAAGLDAALLAMAFGPLAVALLGFPSLLAIDRQTAERTQLLAPRVSVLEGLGIFAAATRAVLESLAAAEIAVEFAAGTPIVREGDSADAMYVLVEGEVEVAARGEAGGPPRVLRRMRGPTYFGEIGVLEHIPRTATVTATTPCRCERIDADRLLAALTTSPPSSTMMENARSRLAVTHPSRRATFAER